jgi:8-oxo-dGTP pyrophosphatase MutT (NUDIX family)
MPDRRRGEWLHQGERAIYESEWVNLHIADVVMPDGTRIDHHLVRMSRPAVGTIMTGDDGVLLLHRHRFITDTWGWEVPAGGVDAGETPEQAAVREALEESGWEPTTVRQLCAFHPANGLLDQTFVIFVSDDAVHRGAPVDVNEAERVEWVPVADVRRLLLDGKITDGLSFGAISYWLAAGGSEASTRDDHR